MASFNELKGGHEAINIAADDSNFLIFINLFFECDHFTGNIWAPVSQCKLRLSLPIIMVYVFIIYDLFL